MKDERNCARCAYLTGTGCSAWDCEFIDREEAIKAYKLQQKLNNPKYKKDSVEETKVQIKT